MAYLPWLEGMDPAAAANARAATATQSIGGGSAAYGSRPVGPPARSTAPSVVPQAQQLQTQVYSQLPGYLASVGNIGANIQSETAGQIPVDVQSAIAQSAAERGVATGNIGGPNTNAALLRAMGLTSLDLTQRGQQGLLAQLPALPGAGISATPGFYLTPQQQYEADLQRAVFAAAPDPAAAAAASMANVGAGFGVGRGSVGGFGGLGAGAYNPQPDMTTGYPNYPAVGALNPVTTAGGSEPGSPGAYAAWNAWNAGGATSPVDQILSRYTPTVTGQDTGEDQNSAYNLGSLMGYQGDWTGLSGAGEDLTGLGDFGTDFYGGANYDEGGY